MSEPMTPDRLPTGTSALVARLRRLNLGKENPETIFGQAATSIVALETRVKALEAKNAELYATIQRAMKGVTRVVLLKHLRKGAANAHGEAK